MGKKEESKVRISEYLHSLRISGGYKTLRDWCILNDFSSVLWSHLENGLWEIVPAGKKLYTQQELSKAREEDWKDKLRELSFMKGYYFKLEDNGLVEKKDDQLVFEREKLEHFIEQELSKAREEGREEGINAVLYPKFRREKDGTLKREGWVDTSKLKNNK